MTLAVAVSLLAALGVGTIIAAVIARWNAVSQLRQTWVDGLRSEIAEFLLAIERVGEAAFGDVQARSELRTRRDQALFRYRQIVLRLNLKERRHRSLDRKLQALLTTGQAADQRKIDEAVTAARRVLKAEWERTKYGPLTSWVQAAKRSIRRWRLSRQLTRLPRKLPGMP